MFAAFWAFFQAILSPLIVLLNTLGWLPAEVTPVADARPIEWIGPATDNPVVDAFAFLPGVSERGPPVRDAA